MSPTSQMWRRALLRVQIVQRAIFLRMTTTEVSLCSAILEDLFGSIVAKVGSVFFLILSPEGTFGYSEDYLLNEAHHPFAALLFFFLIKRSLVIMEQHGVVNFALDNLNIVYSIKVENVFRLARTARCLLITKTLFGEIAEAICDEIVSKGRLSCSQCLQQVLTQKVDVSAGDRKILWRLNYARYERYMRDEMVIDLYRTNDLLDQHCLKTVHALIKVGEQRISHTHLSSFAIHEIVRSPAAKEMKLSLNQIETTLKLLSTDRHNVIRKMGDSSGGLYAIDYEKALTIQCIQRIQSAIREKLGKNSVRIFNLLFQKGYLSEDQIEKMAMLTTKEARSCCYDLMRFKFILKRHMARGNDFSNSRAIYLYHVDLPDVVHLLTLIDRHLKMETIISNIESDPNLDAETKETQVAEVQEVFITSADRNKLAKYHSRQNGFYAAEVKLEKDMLLFSQFLKLSHKKR
ncbi:unnamed protein product [Dracunculus medinensis]|uniref:DNA-directed RNA polymerase III subunit RPC3 n=1 Tax=Dracunculus medinensis TaxID=318479 RepID=A0A158Q441_DRAME|nr:unnamed protein product [Dracunculus medinensis]